MKYIIGNWKTHPDTDEEAVNIAQEIEKRLDSVTGVNSVICPPFVYMTSVKSILRTSKLGAQNMSPFESGSFTGEVSVSQLKDLKVQYLIIGHSERVTYFNETTEHMRDKASLCLKNKITPVVCLGAGLKPGDSAEKIKSKLRRQLADVLPTGAIDNIILVYEPAWAISTSGSGQKPTGAHVKEIVGFLRSLVDKEHVASFSVLYGGHVNGADAKEFNEADGFLVGAASLDADEFYAIAKTLI